MPHAILSPNIPSARYGPPHSRILPLSLIRPNVQFALNAPCTLSLCLLFLLLPQSIQMFAHSQYAPRHPPPEHSFCPIWPSPTTFSAPSRPVQMFAFLPPYSPSARCALCHPPRTFLLPDMALPHHLFPVPSRPVQMFAPLTKKQTPGPCRTPVLSVISSLHRGSAAPPIPAASAAYSQKRPNGR